MSAWNPAHDCSICRIPGCGRPAGWRADVASAKQHLSAAIRHLTRATNESQPDDPLLGILTRMADAYFDLRQETQ